MRARRARQHHPRQAAAFQRRVTLAPDRHADGFGCGIGQRHHPQMLDAIALVVSAVRHHALGRCRKRARLHRSRHRLLDFFVGLLPGAQLRLEIATRRERLVIAPGEAVGHPRLALDEICALTEDLAGAGFVVGDHGGAGAQVVWQDLHGLDDPWIGRGRLFGDGHHGN